MNYYRCENPDCGFLAEEEPDVCPHCGGTFFLSVDEEELTGSDWVQLGNRAVDEERNTDALACYQQAAAAGDVLGLTNLGWCLEAGVGSMYGDKGQSVKWGVPIRYYIKGSPTQADTERVETIIAALNGVPNCPGIGKAESESEATLLINFVPAEEVNKAFATYMEQDPGEGGISGFTYFSENPMTFCRAYISTEATQTTRDFVILTNLFSSMGLFNSSTINSGNIIL